jgi:hypothetical protein
MADQSSGNKRPLFVIPSHTEAKKRISDTVSNCPSAFDLHKAKSTTSSSSSSSSSSSFTNSLSSSAAASIPPPQKVHYLNKPPQHQATSLQEAFPQLKQQSSKVYQQIQQQQPPLPGTGPTNARTGSGGGSSSGSSSSSSAVSVSTSRVIPSIAGRPVILVNRSRQVNNPILKHVHAVGMEVVDGDLIEGGCDFVLGESCGCVFLQV